MRKKGEVGSAGGEEEKERDRGQDGERLRDVTDSYEPADGERARERAGRPGGRRSDGRVPLPPLTTLGELGVRAPRRSHHERPERRQGRLGPEKR